MINISTFKNTAISCNVSSACYVGLSVIFILGEDICVSIIGAVTPIKKHYDTLIKGSKHGKHEARTSGIFSSGLLKKINHPNYLGPKGPTFYSKHIKTNFSPKVVQDEF